MLEIIARLDEIRKNSLFMFTLSDLHHLIRSKKLSASAGFFASLLGIKPVMWVSDDGRVVPREKIRKIERSINYMAETAVAYIDNKDAFVYMADTTLGLYTEAFQELLSSEYGLHNLPVIPVSTVSLANHGPDGIGLGVYRGKPPKLVKYLKPL